VGPLLGAFGATARAAIERRGVDLYMSRARARRAITIDVRLHTNGAEYIVTTTVIGRTDDRRTAL
jgi:hypothetical protein